MTQSRYAFTALAPVFLLAGFVLLSPVVYASWFSLHRIRNGAVGEFTGARNFLRLLDDPTLLPTLGRTLFHTSVSVALTVSIALALAVMLHRLPQRLSTVVNMIVILPWVMSAIVATLLFKWVFVNDIGLSAYFSQFFVGGYVPLTNPNGAMGFLVAVSVWKRVGYAVLVLLAGLKSIPSDYAEAANVDGASAWQTFRLVTLPLMKTPLLLVVVVMTLANMNTVETPMVLTGGGPNDATRILAMDVYDRAFVSFDLGSATALALTMFVANIIMVLAYVRLSNLKV
jgi:multiple sugar transport system permease protein